MISVCFVLFLLAVLGGLSLSCPNILACLKLVYLNNPPVSASQVVQLMCGFN